MTKIAMVFPGQGCQRIGMLADLASQFSIIEQTFFEASEILHYDLWQLTQRGPVEVLNETNYTQPIILVSSVSIYRLWLQLGGSPPKIMAGHSLGEYSALVCAGVLPFSQAISLVALRGKLMNEAVPTGLGAMYAVIGLTTELVQHICSDVSKHAGIVAPGNINSPEQVVIVGQKSAVELAVNKCKLAGARRILPLSVSVPSHCELMKPAANKFAKVLYSINFFASQYPVINNVDVKIETNKLAICDALVRQFYHPVRWVETVRFMANQGVDKIIEIGPGKTLTGFTHRIVNHLDAIAVNDFKSLDEAIKLSA